MIIGLIGQTYNYLRWKYIKTERVNLVLHLRSVIVKPKGRRIIILFSLKGCNLFTSSLSLLVNLPADSASWSAKVLFAGMGEGRISSSGMC